MSYKKASGRGRLDKYYHLAKEKGYRARSAFKLVQLNEKFCFLDKAQVVIDLCAAPGGWLQVAKEKMPVSQVIVGVDLEAIKPITGVATIKADITTGKCRSELQKALKGWQADVVLHDGAPNVGASWDRDAHIQNELVLSALKLAAEFLRLGGTFVTKVFRSVDYDKLTAVFEKVFKKVHVTKPASSRSASAEIFVVCREFSGKVDSDLIDPGKVFANSEEDCKKDGLSLLNKDKQRRHRDGYDEGQTVLYKEITLTALMESAEPEQILCSHNKITVSQEESAHYGLDDDRRSTLHDLKLASRRDLLGILKWTRKFKKAKKAQAVDDEAPPPLIPDVVDPLVELEEIECKLKREAKKKEKKAAVRLEKARQQHAADLATDTQLEPLVEEAPLLPLPAPEIDPNEKVPKRKVKMDWLLLNKYATMKESELKDESFHRFTRLKGEMSSLPDWFVQDELTHSGKQIPITKDEAKAWKERLRMAKTAIPKKVVEAKARNKMRALRKFEALKKKASVLEGSEKLEDQEKLRNLLQNLCKKQTAKKRQKKLIVAKGRLRGIKGRPGGVKGRYKMVDSRMRKDLRNSTINKQKGR